MVARETSRAIDDAAAFWVAREDRGDLSAADRVALETWLHEDSRHPGALLRARAVAMRSEAAQALGEDFDPARFGDIAPSAAAHRPSRRRMLVWGGGLAASFAAVTVAGLTMTAPNAHATERGQMRLVPLPDGSTVMLNTSSRITVRYGRDRRLVRLVEGEADFTVVGDRTRPFVVMVGDRQIETTEGGGFRVRKLARTPVDLLVHQGTMKVVGAGHGKPVIMTPNTQLVLEADDAGAGEVRPQPVSPGLITRELAWREGRIAFEGESLAEAAAAFRRYSDIRIVITDPALEREPVSGLFSANDPVGFGRAAAELFGATAKVGRGEVVLGVGKPPA